jgi:large subunit ribosomal protein L35
VARKQTDGKYKIKTHKATAKRFRVTGTGKLMRTKRLFSEMLQVKGRGIIKAVHRLAPYLKKAD